MPQKDMQRITSTSCDSPQLTEGGVSAGRPAREHSIPKRKRDLRGQRHQSLCGLEKATAVTWASKMGHWT